MSEPVASYDFYNLEPPPERQIARVRPDDTEQLWHMATAYEALRMETEGGYAHSRLHAAVQFVIQSRVRSTEDRSKWVVHDPQGDALIADDACNCQDYALAPQHACSHRLALRLYKAASLTMAELAQRLRAAPGQSQGHGEAPVSVSVSDKGVMLTMRGKCHGDAETLLEQATRLYQSHGGQLSSKPSHDFSRKPLPEPEWEDELDDVPFDFDDLPADDDGFVPQHAPQAEKAPQHAPQAEKAPPQCYYHPKVTMKPSKAEGVEWFCPASNEDKSFCNYIILTNGKRSHAKPKEEYAASKHKKPAHTRR